MVGRGELTDKAWARIEPLLPPIESGGRRWRDHRQVINAILWKLRTGAPWRGLPERYGPWKTAHERLRVWTSDGTWERVLDQVIVKDDSVGNVQWAVSVDSSSVRAHQHSAGPGKKGLRHRVGRTARRGRRSPRTVPWQTDQQDPPRGRRARAAVSVILTPGQTGVNPQLLLLLDQIAVGRDGPSRPRERPNRVLADKAYSHPSTRAALRRRGIGFTSPERSDQITRRAAKGSRGGRPPVFAPDLYANRNIVERCFNWLKQFRGLATRYAKQVAYYQSEIVIAAIVLWLRTVYRTRPS